MSMNLVIYVDSYLGRYEVEIPQTRTETTIKVLGGQLTTLEGEEALEAVFRYLKLRDEEREQELLALWERVKNCQLTHRQLMLEAAEVAHRYAQEAYSILLAIENCPGEDKLTVSYT